MDPQKQDEEWKKLQIFTEDLAIKNSDKDLESQGGSFEKFKEKIEENQKSINNVSLNSESIEIKESLKKPK